VREIEEREGAWAQWRPDTRTPYIRIVSVEGLIGAGKSYLLDGIARYVEVNQISGVGIFKEPVGEWSAEQIPLNGRSLLQEIAAKPEGSSFAFQALALVGYYMGIGRVVESMCECIDFKRTGRVATIFVERSPDSNLLFATYGSDQGWWTPAECVVYRELCSMLRHATDIPGPCVRIVVAVDQALAGSRIASRGRLGEEQIAGSVIQSRMEEFLNSLSIVNEEECASTTVLRSDQVEQALTFAGIVKPHADPSLTWMEELERIRQSVSVRPPRSDTVRVEQNTGNLHRSNAVPAFTAAPVSAAACITATVNTPSSAGHFESEPHLAPEVICLDGDSEGTTSSPVQSSAATGYPVLELTRKRTTPCDDVEAYIESKRPEKRTSVLTSFFSSTLSPVAPQRGTSSHPPVAQTTALLHPIGSVVMGYKEDVPRAAILEVRKSSLIVKDKVTKMFVTLPGIGAYVRKDKVGKKGAATPRARGAVISKGTADTLRSEDQGKFLVGWTHGRVINSADSFKDGSCVFSCVNTCEGAYVGDSSYCPCADVHPSWVKAKKNAHMTQCVKDLPPRYVFDEDIPGGHEILIASYGSDYKL
jgi:thymidylate kinase